jgi:hypothetical protein
MSKTIGELADEMFAVREKKKLAEELVKAIGEELALAEQALMEAADAQQTTAGKGKLASFTVGESVVPQVKDWDAFYKYIYKNKFAHLLERRPSVTGCRELFDTKGAIPGVEKFTKRKINLRGV